MDGRMEGNRTGWNCDLENPGEGLARNRSRDCEICCLY
jgi:hypothetical protein